MDAGSIPAASTNSFFPGYPVRAIPHRRLVASGEAGASPHDFRSRSAIAGGLPKYDLHQVRALPRTYRARTVRNSGCHMLRRSFALTLGIAAAIALGGCATRATRLDAQWVNPEFAGQRSVQRVLVLAATRDTTNRRMFEDRMVDALSAAGAKAVQSYKFIPTDGPISEEQLRRAVADAGVDHALVSRISNVTTEVNVTPGMVMGPTWGPGWGWNNGWGPGWGGFTGYHNAMWTTTVPPRVTTTQNVHADTRVFDAKTAVVVWSAATTTSTGWDSVPQLIGQFVDLIVETLKKDRVI